MWNNVALTRENYTTAAKMELVVPSRIPRNESWSDADKRMLIRNEAQLNFVSLRSRFHGVGATKSVKGLR
jgi:hypothetical protein